MSVKELLINKLDLMSESELEKVLKLLQVFGLADRTSSQSKSYPLRGLPIEYIDPMEPVAVGDWDDCVRYAYLDLVGTWRLKA